MWVQAIREVGGCFGPPAKELVMLPIAILLPFVSALSVQNSSVCTHSSLNLLPLKVTSGINIKTFKFEVPKEVLLHEAAQIFPNNEMRPWCLSGTHTSHIL